MSKNHTENPNRAPIDAPPIREGDAAQAPVQAANNNTDDKLKHEAYLRYVEAVDALASTLYHQFPRAGFTRETITELAMESNGQRPWQELSPKVKLCIVRLAMAMMPKETVVSAPTPSKPVSTTVAPAVE